MNRRIGCLALLVLTLAGCAAPVAPDSVTGAAPSDPASTALLAPEPRSGESQWTVDAAASDVTFFVYRGGRLERLGHNHVVSFGHLEGGAAVTEASVGSRFLLNLPLDSVVIDDAARRRAAGEDFASEPSDEDIAATRINMLGEDGLHTARHPLAQVAGTVTRLDGDRARLDVQLRIHGTTVARSIEGQWQRSPEGIMLRGQIKALQSDFGITPFSVLGGALVVVDEVLIRFDLTVRPAT